MNLGFKRRLDVNAVYAPFCRFAFVAYKKKVGHFHESIVTPLQSNMRQKNCNYTIDFYLAGLL